MRIELRGARDLICDLSILLPRALDATDHPTTPLREEVDFLLQYLAIEQVRLGGELHVRIDISDEIKDVQVPSLLLQPLVENAVKHGLQEEGPLQVSVRGVRRAGRVCLEVVNSGRWAARSECEGDPKGSWGLRLVRDRLATDYPHSGGLTLDEDEGEVVVRVEFDPTERVPDALSGALV